MKVPAAKLCFWMCLSFAVGFLDGPHARAAAILFNGSVTENFDSFAGTAGSIPGGFSTTGTQTYKGLDDGGNGQGGYWSFGINSATDRAFGMIETSSTVTGLGLVVALNNNTGSSINRFTLGYTLEEWRDGNSGSDRQNGFALRYSTDGTTFTSAIRTDGAPVNNNQGKLDGNAIANKVVVSGFDYIPASPIAPGATVYFEWQFMTVAGSTGNRDGIGLDDVTITAVPEPSTWIAGVFALGVIAAELIRQPLRDYRWKVIKRVGSVTIAGQ
jgi:hypothetical protein